MLKIKKTIYWISWLLILYILIMGLYKGGEMLYNYKKLKVNGIESIGIVEKVWRGKCGSGYGYFVKYKFEVNGENYKSISSCTASKTTKVGERYYVLYLEEDPTQSRILFDKKISDQ
ncbi:DUF3592 domain-containing protein [Cyclobacterium sp. SYSU L10401]|uniref:DUF3592 domain-containing protein n=1 Tax=Cyclobacterium sp. SYSU L10401 TaxID=2678657 RepID=UPI0013D4D844|nr:DUF3592 domain-containing protein [Cyclobacterium sp. SYSU L10401]